MDAESAPGSTVTDERLGPVPFQAHVELLHVFLAHRDEIVERIQGVLNAQRKPAQYLQDRPLLSRHFEECFFELGAVARDASRLRRELEEAHWASGFKPRAMPGLHNDLVDPAEMMIRGFHLWQGTRWPGRNGRVRYAHTLFNLYVLRRLELLSMRLWDAGPGSAAERLSQAQGVLDALWRSSPADQPAIVRDARWLIPLAQSPTTDELGPYFDVAERIAESLSDEDRVEIRKASVRMIGGHLRSQIRHYCVKEGVSIDEHSVVLRTRTSNALDLALLIQGLVPLLEAYERSRCGEDGRARLELAGAVCQGISPDPELFLNRLDLLGAYSMIEHLFVTADREGQAAYTPMGLRHLRLFREYEALIRRLAKPLYEDCPRFKPVPGAYSPYGAIYGTPSNLTEHMALKAIQPDAATRFSVEDVFADGDAGPDKLAWVNGWRKLPHIDSEVQSLFDYPQRFAEDIFDRIEQALRRRASAGETCAAAPRTGRLFILPGEGRPAGSAPQADSGRKADLSRQADSAPQRDSEAASIPDLPVRYIRSSDGRLEAEPCDQTQLLRDRQEGMFVVSYETSDGWVAVTKDILTEILGAGCDAKIALPPAAGEVLRLMCPGLVSPAETDGRQHRAAETPRSP
jgi:hypothetical protein